MFVARWNIVIHGAIDGYSRMIVFLHASDNNRKETVLQQFLVAMAQYGTPSRIRVDHGGENNDICDVMNILRGASRGSAIRGSSVHNQRIERLWVDVWNSVTNVYYQLFNFLESRDLLNPDNIVHLWALHYCFMQRINSDLKTFQNQWNNHGLRTQGHMTPTQLFVKECLHLAGTDTLAIRELLDDTPAARAPDLTRRLQPLFLAAEQPHSAVVVPHIQCPLSDNEVTALNVSCNSLIAPDGDIGLALYEHVLTFISHAISN